MNLPLRASILRPFLYLCSLLWIESFVYESRIFKLCDHIDESKQNYILVHVCRKYLSIGSIVLSPHQF